MNDSTARVCLKRSLHISSSWGDLIGNMGCFSKDFHFQRIFLIFQPISEITNDIVPDVIRYFNIPFLWQSTCLSLLRERHWPEHTLTHTHTRIYSFPPPPTCNFGIRRSECTRWTDCPRTFLHITVSHSPIHLTHIIRVLSFVLLSTFECLFVCQEVGGLSVGERCVGQTERTEGACF